MADRLIEALRALGIDERDMDPDVLEALRDAAPDEPPDVRVRAILAAEGRGEPVDEAEFWQLPPDLARETRNRAHELRIMHRAGRGDPAAYATSEAERIIREHEHGPPPEPEPDVAEVADRIPQG